MNDPRDEFPFLGPSGADCGCLLPTSGVILVALTAGLAWALRTRTEGWTPLWLLLIPLVAGIVALYVRIRWPKRGE